MAFNKEQALNAARDILNGARTEESPRLERIHKALQPFTSPGEYRPTVQIPEDAPKLMKELARKSESNYLLLAVKAYRQVIKAEGYYTKSDEDATDPWVWWQRNGMDARQTGIVDNALKYGVGYACVLPGTYGRLRLPGPTISTYSPREMTAVYQDPEVDEWPMMTLGVDGQIVSLMDDEMVYRFGIEKPWPGGPLTNPAAAVLTNVGRLTYIDQNAHEVGVPPVIRFRDRWLTAGEEQLGIIEPLLTVSERIDETTFQMQVAQYFQAFKQRYVIGWVPKSEQEELKAGAARMWYLDEDPKDVRIDELQSGAIQPYIDSRNSGIRDFASTAQLPVPTFGIDGISNISDATLAGLEAGKNREAGEISTSLGEGFEQMLRLCAHIDGNEAAADDYSSEIRWRDYEARSFAATIDALSKMVTMMGLDPALALEDVPGMTEQKLLRAQNAMKKQRAVEVLRNRGASGADSGATA